MRNLLLFSLAVLAFSACEVPVVEMEEDVGIVIESPMPYEEVEVNNQGLVEAYVQENISQIAPIEAVLGGSWYVLEVAFEEGEVVRVLAEDGHIETNFSARYSVSADGEVRLSDFEVE